MAVAEDLSLEEGDRVLFSAVDLRLDPGQTLVVSSPDPVAARSLLLTLAGRVAPSDGLLKVCGHLLPGRGAWVRSHVGVALLTDTDDPMSELRSALAGSPRLVVIDGLDAVIGDAERDQASALLRDAADRSPDGRLALVVSARREPAALALLAEARRPDVTGLTLTTNEARTSSNEVNA